MRAVSFAGAALIAAATASLAAVAAVPASAAPTVHRLTPPSNLFASGNAFPIVARFLPGQRFDLQATVSPDAGSAIDDVQFLVDGAPVGGQYSASAPTAAALPAGATIVSRRAYSLTTPGVHTLQVTVRQADGSVTTASGNFEIAGILPGGRRAKNIIVLIGDGMGIAHRTAARLMLRGLSQGKANGPLAMDTFPVTGLVMTASLNSIVTDSAPGAHCYSTGNKANNNEEGVFPDDTPVKNSDQNGDNPRIENIGEYLYRSYGKVLGIVTTADVEDATPAAFAVHTQDRGAGSGICDQYLDESNRTGLRVLLGGGRKWFLPAGTAGSGRTAGRDYTVPADVAAAWNVPTGLIDPGRDLLGDFQSAGFTYAATRGDLLNVPASTNRLLGLFHPGNMNVAFDKINGQRGASTVTGDEGFPDQPMLDEMTDKALQVLSRNRQGFVLMVEGASIDKQAHAMDSERWILDTIEFDRAVGVCRRFAEQNPDTLVVVTADHECAGVNIIGAGLTADLQASASAGVSGVGDVRVYDAAGFPQYAIAPDGYPVTTDPARKLLIGYAANAARFEDWLTNPFPAGPLALPGTGPGARDSEGNYIVTAQVPGESAVHTASDIPVSAFGRGANLFTGVMDNTDVFFKAMQAALGGAK